MPGDITAHYLRAGADQETVELFRQRWGLDEPLYVQYVNYFENLLIHQDLGNSLNFGVPVLDYVLPRLLNTFILVAPAITTGYVVGSIWGTVIASTKRNWLENYGLVFAIMLGTIPIFFLGMMAIIVFSLRLNIFPTGGMVSSATRQTFTGHAWWRIYFTGDFIWHYLLPFSVVALRYSYLPTLLMNTSVREVKSEGFNYYHRITGLPGWRRKFHLAKHASLPVITFYPLSMARAIGGLVLIEYIFNWPGVGVALVQAVFNRDLPVLEFVFFAVAAFIILGNFVVDIVYGWIDPRVSVED
jgi:peptide/nickel transport system permease protein